MQLYLCFPHFKVCQIWSVCVSVSVCALFVWYRGDHEMMTTGLKTQTLHTNVKLKLCNEEEVVSANPSLIGVTTHRQKTEIICMLFDRFARFNDSVRYSWTKRCFSAGWILLLSFVSEILSGGNDCASVSGKRGKNKSGLIVFSLYFSSDCEPQTTGNPLWPTTFHCSYTLTPSHTNKCSHRIHCSSSNFTVQHYS